MFDYTFRKCFNQPRNSWIKFRTNLFVKDKCSPGLTLSIYWFDVNHIAGE